MFEFKGEHQILLYFRGKKAFLNALKNVGYFDLPNMNRRVTGFPQFCVLFNFPPNAVIWRTSSLTPVKDL